MSSPYDERKTELINQITAQKLIYKFRVFMYTLNKDVRFTCFTICERYLNNEFYDNTTITATERERLPKLMTHWNWSTFDNASTDWWRVLSSEHSKSLTLMTLIHLWIDDINAFDAESFETSTIGLR
jgi:hypothetical protein